MKKLLVLVILALLVGCDDSPQTVTVYPPNKDGKVPTFEMLDTNGDEDISKVEWDAFY